MWRGFKRTSRFYVHDYVLWLKFFFNMLSWENFLIFNLLPCIKSLWLLTLSSFVNKKKSVDQSLCVKFILSVQFHEIQNVSFITYFLHLLRMLLTKYIWFIILDSMRTDRDVLLRVECMTELIRTKCFGSHAFSYESQNEIELYK